MAPFLSSLFLSLCLSLFLIYRSICLSVFLPPYFLCCILWLSVRLPRDSSSRVRQSEEHGELEENKEFHTASAVSLSRNCCFDLFLFLFTVCLSFAPSLSVCLSVSLSLCLSVSLTLCLSVRLSVRLSLPLSVPHSLSLSLSRSRSL